jgi:transposase
MLTTLLQSLLPGLCVLNVQATSERIFLDMISAESSAACPLCERLSSAVHSLYPRTLADLPWCGVPVVLRLQVRKFFCRNKTCKRKVFAERLARVTLPYSRQTTRLRNEQRLLCLECGGEAAARTSVRQGFSTSAKTHIRRVCRSHHTPAATPRVLGVDDWAMRKGQIYGTILVDLEQHQPVDLLPDRSAATLKQWLCTHPGVEIISRDRANDYAEGARCGAPGAIQVADRFHLVKNVQEVLQRIVERHSVNLRVATATVNASLPVSSAPAMFTPEDEQQIDWSETIASTPPTCETAPADILPKYQQQIQERRAKRHARYCEVQKLRKEGASIRQIARQLGIHVSTVRRFLPDQFPERASRPPLPSILDPYVPFLTQQLMAGRDNGMQLWRELCRDHGYRGSRAMVSRWIAANRSLCPPKPMPTPRKGRPPSTKPNKPAPRFKTPSAKATSWMLMAEPESLDEDQSTFIETLVTSCPEVRFGQQLANDFRRLVKERDIHSFDKWLADVGSRKVAEFVNFAAGLRRDEAAVRAALSLPYSNGQVEGQVNRLKLIKRGMYGRASFELLKRRVLAA